MEGHELQVSFQCSTQFSCSVKMGKKVFGIVVDSRSIEQYRSVLLLLTDAVFVLVLRCTFIVSMAEWTLNFPHWLLFGCLMYELNGLRHLECCLPAMYYEVYLSWWWWWRQPMEGHFYFFFFICYVCLDNWRWFLSHINVADCNTDDIQSTFTLPQWKLQHTILSSPETWLEFCVADTTI